MAGVPEAIHVGAADLPYVEIGGGNRLKVLHVDERQGLWIVQNVFMAGFTVQTHRHTGPVYGYTTSGAWKYREYTTSTAPARTCSSRPDRCTP